MARGDKGFTLIEVLMSIVVIGIISAVAATLLLQGARSFQTIDSLKELTQQGTLALERISRELRLMACTKAGNACVPQATDITAMNPSEIRFVNADSIGRGFRIDAGAIKLRQGSASGDPEDVLASGASSLTFEYLKKDGSGAAAVTDVWTINVTLTLQSGPESLDFKASVHPRSFR